MAINSRPTSADRDVHPVALATVLARAVREGDLRAIDVLRVLRRELRGRNTDKKTTLAVHSTGAREVIDRSARNGRPVPMQGSLDALRADHGYARTSDDLANHCGVDEWLSELSRLREMVCVTAAENYRLEVLDRAGAAGWGKHEAAGIIDLSAQTGFTTDAHNHITFTEGGHRLCGRGSPPGPTPYVLRAAP